MPGNPVTCGLDIVMVIEWIRNRRPVRARRAGVAAGLLLAVSSVAAFGASAHVRLNQAGYLPFEAKQAILLASGAEAGSFVISNALTGSNAFSAAIPASSLGRWSSAFPDAYLLDFSSVTNEGVYIVQVNAAIPAASPAFKIGDPGSLYLPLLTNALFYYQSSRDGPNAITNVISRQPCHFSDTNSFTYLPPVYDTNDILVGGLTNIGGPLDATGGWFDAGDYIKLIETTSYVEGMMLFASRQYPDLLGSGNSMANFLPEAAFGLDWLLKMWDQTNQVLYFAQCLGTANYPTIVGDNDIWRLPQADDQLNVSPGDPEYYIKYRPVFQAGTNGTPISPNLAGRLAAAFALASQVFGQSNAALANRCLIAAQTIFDLANTNFNDSTDQLLTATPHDFYPETSWRDDLEWGATELYFATAQTNLPPGLAHANASFYLGWAAFWANAYINGPDDGTDTLNLYDTSALAHYELYHAISAAGNPPGLAVTRAQLLSDLASQLDSGVSSQTDPFGFAGDYSADPVPHELCFAIMANLYRDLSGAATYDSFGRTQRDWVLGRNAWGTTFIVGAGSVFPECMQDQIANLSGSLNGALPLRLGATVDGPNSDLSGSGTVDGMNSCNDNAFSTFDGGGGKYRDNVAYWMTVEPALDYTVPTILLFAQQIGQPMAAQLESPSVSADGIFIFTVAGTSGYNYTVETSADLANWSLLQTNLSPFIFAATNSPGASPQFYRAVHFP